MSGEESGVEQGTEFEEEGQNPNSSESLVEYSFEEFSTQDLVLNATLLEKLVEKPKIG